MDSFYDELEDEGEYTDQAYFDQWSAMATEARADEMSGVL